MSQTGAASLASGLISLAATKFIATAFGPASVALLSTLQQIRAIGTTCGSLSGQTALVQGANSLAGRERREFLRTVSLLLAISTMFVVAVLIVFPQWVAIQTGLAASDSRLIRGMSISAILAIAYLFITGLLNARRAIGSLALIQLAAPASMAVLAYTVTTNADRLNGDWFVLMLTASSTVAVLAAWLALRKRFDSSWFKGDGGWWSNSALRKFFAISGSLFLSGSIYSWIIAVVRARVLRTQGLSTAGQLDAAWAISMNQAGLVLASLQTYYLPTLAGISDPRLRSTQITRVLTFATLSAAAIVTTLIALKPFVLTTLYSSAFTEAARYLRWTLPGDYLKITSWILSVPLLASAHMRTFLAADLVAYGAFVATALGVATSFSAAESMSIAFVAMYAAHLVFCGSCLWLRGEFRPDARTVYLWCIGLAAVGVVSAAFWEQA
jgi:PST family polysaccharide transporter